MMPSKQLMSTLAITEAQVNDFDEVAELYNHLHTSEAVDPENIHVKEMWEQIISDARIQCFVAKENNICVSTCLIDIVPNLTRGAKPFAVLQNVVTHTDYRGQGIGAELNTYALEYAWKMNCYQVLVQTSKPKAISFYEKLGFRHQKVGLVAKPEW